MSLLAQDEKLTRRVGAIALAVIAAAIVFFVFVYDRIELGSPTRVKVYFGHSAGLRERAPLVVAGQAVGHVESVENVLHGGTNPLKGEVGIVAIVAIDDGSAWKVPAGADIFVSSRGPLSDKYLEVAPPKHDAPPGTPVTEGAELLAADPPSLDNVLQHTWDNMATFRLFAEQVRPELAAFRAQIDALRGHFADTATDLDLLSPGIRATASLIAQAGDLRDEARATYEVSLGGEPGLAHFRAMLADARTTLAQTRATLDKLQPLADRLIADARRAGHTVTAADPIGRFDAALAQLRAVLDKVDPLVAKVDDINARLARGEGSLGLLMHDPEFPEDAKELGKILKRQPWKVIAKPKD